MARSRLWLIIILTLTGCNQFVAIPFTPSQTPETWLTIQPVIELPMPSGTLIVVQPTTSALVYLLGLITIGVGRYFLRKRNPERSRLWWGIALLLWGIGAILAGTSYEAYSYQIKCAGRETCIWTSWWEIGYLVTSVASIDAMLIGQTYACATGRWRTILMTYAIINLTLYVILVLVGTLALIPFLISFEFLLLVGAPTIVLFILINGYRYLKLKLTMDLALLGTWAWLALTLGAYFLYFLSGLTQRLWSQGIWFSDNDVLHIGLIVWMIYIAAVVARRIEDEPPPLAALAQAKG